MLLVGYVSVIGLLLLGVMDLLAWATAHHPDRLKRAKLLGGAAWLFGVGGSALALATGFAEVGTATPDQKALVLAALINRSVGPAVLGLVGGMLLVGIAAFLGSRYPDEANKP